MVYIRKTILNRLLLFLGGSSTASTKSATIEMYVGSSTGYNDTMSGETMSSISEKSGSYISGNYFCVFSCRPRHTPLGTAFVLLDLESKSIIIIA